MPTAEAAKTGFKPKTIPTKKSRPRRNALSLALGYLLLGSLCGCSLFTSAAVNSAGFLKHKTSAVTEVVHSKTLHYLGDSELEYYKDVATQIDYTRVEQAPNNNAAFSEPPRRIRHPNEDEIVTSRSPKQSSGRCPIAK
jgi:hypothetical protein